MDKYEYNLKKDQMKALVAEGNYNAAAEIADSINWRKEKNVNLLVKAGDIYAKLKRYDEAKEILLMAYDRSPIGRMIIYRLAEISIKMKDLEEAEDILNRHKEALRFDHIESDDKIGKVSIVGAGLMSNCGVAAKMFEALYESGINIQMINTSEIRVSVLLDEDDVNKAVKAIHAKFFDEL